MYQLYVYRLSINLYAQLPRVFSKSVIFTMIRAVFMFINLRCSENNTCVILKCFIIACLRLRFHLRICSG
jgi:hypothetical protein